MYFGIMTGSIPASTSFASPSAHSSSLSACTPYLIAMLAVCRYPQGAATGSGGFGSQIRNSAFTSPPQQRIMPLDKPSNRGDPVNQPPPPAQPPQPAPQNVSRKKAIALVAGAAVAAFAIGGGAALLLQNDDSSDDKPTVAKATETSTPPSPSPSPSEEEQELQLGDTVDIDDGVGSLTATALSYRDTGIKGWPEMLGAGEKWAVLDVKVCNTSGDPIQTSPLPWSLAYEGGVRIDSAGTNAGDLPKPLYPMDAKVAAGDCVRGNIVFQVPKEGRPERVLYSPEVVDEPVEWQVSKG